MKEILFRGKRIDNGEWVEGDLLHSYFKKGDTCICCPDWTNIKRVDPATVGQYTGLVDKSGKKIFEGDVVKQGGEIGEVYYERNYCTFAIILKRNMDLFKHIKYNCEITGNIHDNPELLR